jgi:ribose transport system substrate-binding protein
MKTTKQIALTMLVLAIVFTSGCTTESKDDVYYLIATNVKLPYWQTVANGFNKAAAQYKVTAKVVGPDSYDPVSELDALQKAVRTKPAGILISVADVSTVQREIDLAVQEGIPVITVDSDALVSRRLYFIGTNNLDAGRQGGGRLVEKLGNKGNVVFFTIPGQPNTEDRLRGFKEVLNTQPGIKIADIVDIKGDASTAFDKAQHYLALTGPQKVDAIVCLEAVSGKPASDAIKRANLHDRELITWDADPGTLDAIKDGTIDATIAQKPYTMGYFGLKLLYEVFHAPPPQLNKDFRSDFYSPYPVFIDTGTTLVDRGNVDLYLSATAANK